MKILIKFLPLIVFIFVLTASKNAVSQLEDKTMKGNDKEFFFADPMVFYSKEHQKARLDLYIEIPLENLQFKKNYQTKNYDASLNYNVKIVNSAGEVVTNESINDFITTTKAEQKTLDESAKFIVKEFYLNPGIYNLEIALTDINTKHEKVVKKSIDVKDFPIQDISFSDIMLVSNYRHKDGKKIVTPLVDNNIDNLNELVLFFEVYNSKDQNVVNNYNYKVIDSKDNIVEKGSYYYTLVPGTNKFFEKIPTKNLVFGKYKYEINDNTTGALLAQREFSNSMSGIPVNMKDLRLLIDQLLYIANSDELSKIKNASSNELKEKYFIEFWKSKDPSPNTGKNELMIEYYRRIKIANERYSHYIDGWKTDMGMVYIIFGEPSNVERYPFTENTKPYEVWEFYNENRQFVFVDDTGFGDYKLTTPIWDEQRTRIRN